MRRIPSIRGPLPHRIAASALAGTILAEAALAQAPNGIDIDLLDVAREALPAVVQPATPDSAVQGNADAPELVAVPHPSGGAEIFPLPERADEEGTEAESGPQDPAARTSVADAASASPDPAIELGSAATPAQAAIAPATSIPGGGTPETGVETDFATEGSPDPLEVLKGLWREAVASGNTSDGFQAWVAAALNPAPEAPERPGSQASLTREVAAAWNRRTGPVTLGDAGRVVTTFGAAIPVAHCSPLTVCYIELEPGEKLTDTPSVGDAVRWQVVVKTQGVDPETPVLEIKPAQDAVETNLVIPTDRRLYSIALVNDPEYHTPILAFRWPDSEARAVAEGIERRQAEELALQEASEAAAASRAEITAAEMARSGVPTEAGPRAAELLDFRFRVTGDAPFRPVRVFADSARTYIDLHPSYRGPLPAIVAGKAEGNAALNTRVSASGSRLVADRVITDVWLQSGKQRVRIRRMAN